MPESGSLTQILKEMKTKIIALCSLMFLSAAVYSQQKIGYVDSKLIIETLQDGRDAQTNLDNLIQKWKVELQSLNDSLLIMQDDFDKKKLILTEKVRQQKEDEIKSQEKAIADFRQQKFGENGEYFQRQSELMKPVQDRIFKAIQDVAREGGFDFVIDRSSQLMLLYMNDRYDLTQKVINKLESQ
jgi:outer membrane protein